MDDMMYTEVKIQDYFLNQEFTTSQKRNIFLFRTRMANFSENFQGFNPPLPCKICRMDIDSQSHSVICFLTIKDIKQKGNYEEIFLNKISKDTAVMLGKIMEIRKKKDDKE